MSQVPLILRHYYSLFSIMPKEFPNGIDLNEIIQNLAHSETVYRSVTLVGRSNQPSTFMG